MNRIKFLLKFVVFHGYTSCFTNTCIWVGGAVINEFLQANTVNKMEHLFQFEFSYFKFQFMSFSNTKKLVKILLIYVCHVFGV